MSISSFCLEQREKEKAALKSILAFSIAGSAALHLVLAFGFALLVKEPSLVDNAIEIVVLDAPEPEIKQPELETPKPTPQPVVTPTPEKLVSTPTPESIVTPTPEPIVRPKIDTARTKVEAPKPLEIPKEPKEINEPIKTPTPAEPEKVAERLAPPRIAENPKEELQKPDPQPTKPETETPNTSQPLPTPLANARNFKEQLVESQPVENETSTEETPNLPGGLTANQQPAVNSSTITSQPIESSRGVNREFRDRIAATNNSTTGANPGDDASFTNPVTPEEVTRNRENSANKPTATSQPLQSSSSRNRVFRNIFANPNNSPTTTNPADDISAASPGVPREVTADNQRPSNRPVGGSKPLQSATNNRGFRDSFSNNNNTSTSRTNSNISPTVPGTSTGVAVNRPPARRNTRQEGENIGGNRQTARRSGRGGGLRCVSECNPEYPSDLENVEGRPVIQFVVKADGSTAEPQLVESSGNNKLDEVAVEAVRKMRFAPADEGSRTVKLAINFATSGSDFERQARERREENKRQRRERERQRQEDLDREN
ncbi:TonB family protein [Floridanema aerugineum]|uniref:TonB family protein n=1 Tax=Floridaenema aerugineum BLCC-F46 TaxID=3153654 RepID=A0ABV4X3K5_9CYAN